MKRRLIIFVLIAAVLIPLFALPAAADTGPKPSVVINFKGLEDESYYVTLLSDRDQVGPWCVETEYSDWMGERYVWDVFSSYSDEDGFLFLSCYADCSETDCFKWTYYPPTNFKILIYFPEYDRIVVSDETYDRYAFDSYFTLNASRLDLQSDSPPALKVKKTYNFTWEILSLLARIVITLAIELAIALLFGFRSKKQLKFIFITNIITQVILNVLLNIINYRLGQFAFVFNYVWMELLVLVIEGLLYRFILCRNQEGEKKLHPWAYSVVANICSFIGGLLIAHLLPGIF